MSSFGVRIWDVNERCSSPGSSTSGPTDAGRDSVFYGLDPPISPNRGVAENQLPLSKSIIGQFYNKE